VNQSQLEANTCNGLVARETSANESRLMFTLPALRDVLPARSARGETKEGWSPKRSWGPDRGGRCLDDCYGNRDHSEALSTESHRWNGVKVMRKGPEKKEDGKEGAKIGNKNTAKQQQGFVARARLNRAEARTLLR